MLSSIGKRNEKTMFRSSKLNITLKFLLNRPIVKTNLTLTASRIDRFTCVLIF